MTIKIVCILAGTALILAIPTGWPYDFYVLLRWVIFFAASFVAYNFYKSGLQAWTFVFGGLAFLFNPILPIYLNKSTWVPIDFIGAILFFIASQAHKQKL